METLVANLSGKTRRVTRDGTAYLVAPMTLLVPGVLNGSAGALYYPPDEVSKNPAGWDGMPLVVDHPSANGKAISAQEGDYALQKGVGHVHNSSVDRRGRLRAEGWFATDALARVEPRILTALESGRPVSLSTGLTLSAEPAPAGAVHNGRAYAFIARNYQPDHVAVFAEAPGACSIADGCGVLVGNALSHRTLHERLASLVAERFGPPLPSDDPSTMPWLVDVFDSYVVFAQRGDFYRLDYRTDLRSGSVELSTKTPVEVALSTSYKPVNNRGRTNVLTPEQRQEAITSLVANGCSCQGEVPWKGKKETDLQSLSDDTLVAYDQWRKALVGNAAGNPQPTPQPSVAPAPAPAPAATPVTQPVANAGNPAPATPKRSAEDWANEVFPGLSLAEVQGAVRDVMEFRQRHKAELIERFTANLAAGHDRDQVGGQLASFDVEVLQKLLPLAELQRRQPVHNWAAAGGAPLARGQQQPDLVPYVHDYRNGKGK